MITTLGMVFISGRFSEFFEFLNRKHPFLVAFDARPSSNGQIFQCPNFYQIHTTVLFLWDPELFQGIFRGPPAPAGPVPHLCAPRVRRRRTGPWLGFRVPCVSREYALGGGLVEIRTSPPPLSSVRLGRSTIGGELAPKGASPLGASGK